MSYWQIYTHKIGMTYICMSFRAFFSSLHYVCVCWSCSHIMSKTICCTHTKFSIEFQNFNLIFPVIKKKNFVTLWQFISKPIRHMITKFCINDKFNTKPSEVYPKNFWSCSKNFVIKKKHLTIRYTHYPYLFCKLSSRCHN